MSFSSKEPHMGLGISESEAILALSEMEWNEDYYSLPCSWNLLVRHRKKQKESFIPSTEDDEKAIPCTFRTVLGPGTSPPVSPPSIWVLSFVHLFSLTFFHYLTFMLHNLKLSPPTPLIFIFPCLLVVRFSSVPWKRISFWVGTHFPPLEFYPSLNLQLL